MSFLQERVYMASRKGLTPDSRLPQYIHMLTSNHL